MQQKMALTIYLIKILKKFGAGQQNGQWSLYHSLSFIRYLEETYRLIFDSLSSYRNIYLSTILSYLIGSQYFLVKFYMYELKECSRRFKRHKNWLEILKEELENPEGELRLNTLGITAEDIPQIINNFEQSLATFRSIQLQNNSIRSEGVKSLTKGNFYHLRELWLGGNQIGAQGTKYLANIRFNNLVKLWLGDNSIGSEGVKQLANGSFNKLQQLNLMKNRILCEGIRHLADGNFLNLKLLNLDSNNVGFEGAKFLASEFFSCLTILQFCNNDISWMRKYQELRRLLKKIGNIQRIYY